MYVRIFNDGWAELEEIKQEKKQAMFLEKNPRISFIIGNLVTV